MSRTLLAHAIDISQWLEADAMTPDAERILRDRNIGRQLASTGSSGGYQRVLAWWDEISKSSKSHTSGVSVGHRVASLASLANGILALLGIVLGVGIAGVAFGYQGDFPVNLFALLGVLVGFPLIMLLLSLLLMSGRGLVPGSILDSIAILSPGRWVGAFLERHVGLGLFESVAGKPMRGQFARWQLLAFSQTFAIGYFIGVLIVAWALIIFTDLAFGWSTTLEIDTASVASGMTALALPWSGWLPVAVPDLALVEASRFYRLDAHLLDDSRAAELGRWWPFVLMAILTYGLLPRVLLSIVASWQVKRTTKRLLEEGPEITALLDRLKAPAVTFEGSGEEDSIESDGVLSTVSPLEFDRDSAVIVWNNALTEAQLKDFLRTRDRESITTLFAAEWQSTKEQRDQLKTLDRDCNRIVILAKGWEPPLLAFSDYLAQVREVLGTNAVMVVVPLDTSLKGVAPTDREVWARTLARSDDPRRYVVGATE